MFTIDANRTIHITRGDVAAINVRASSPDGATYFFKPTDIVRFKVYEKKRCDNILLKKDITAGVSSETVTISLVSDDTKIGELINKPVDYWYEVELNPDTAPQTIIGYDMDGPKVFRIYPEGEMTSGN